MLCDQRVWDDKGTGHVACVPSPEHQGATFIVVRLEHSGKLQFIKFGKHSRVLVLPTTSIHWKTHMTYILKDDLNFYIYFDFVQNVTGH